MRRLALMALALGCAPPPGPLPIAQQQHAQMCEAPPGPSATDRLFDDRAPPPRISLTIAPADMAFLDEDPRREAYVPCTVDYGEARFERGACRYKGAFGSLFACVDDNGDRTCPKLSWKVSFNEYVDGGRFLGLRKMVFNSSVRDPSMMRERLSYALFRAAGIKASRAVHARLSVNGGPDSLFVLVENVDKEWLEERFEDPTGNLFKERWPQHSEAQPWLDGLRTNKDDPDLSRMIELSDLLEGVTPAEFNESLDPWIDRVLMSRYFVVDQVTHNWDGIWKFYCHRGGCGNHNFYLYDDPESGRVVVIPWDLDHTFTQPNADLARSWLEDDRASCEQPGQTRPPQCDPLLRGLMRENLPAYETALAELTRDGGPLSEAAIMTQLDAYRAQLAPFVEVGDPQGPTPERWRRGVGQLRQIIRTQMSHVRLYGLELAP
jgi:spore coat protein H